MKADTRVPIATYRLQLHRGFPLDAARDIAGYLKRLGISDLYLSPIMQARAGSTHGYDVVDPTTISRDLGGAEAFERLGAELRRHGAGILLDIVPNHMAATPANRWWLALLRDGRDSPEAAIFDVDWDAPQPGLAGKITLPILGDHYAAVLERDEIAVSSDDEGIWITYFDQRLPVSQNAASRAALEAYLEAEGQASGETRRDLLDRLLECQHYRLSFWRTGNRIINYRRFFDIGSLIALRMQDAATFELMHARVRDLARSGQVTGLRIDHVDGLRDPAAYLRRLQSYILHEDGDRRFYILVEKILTANEPLPEEWPVAGTTGYDFANVAGGVLSNGQGLADLVRITRMAAPEEADFAEIVYRAKHQVVDELFPSEFNRLAWQLAEIACRDRRRRDLTLEELEAAVREMTVALPVYRTYISGRDVRPEDRDTVAGAVASARCRRPDLEAALDFIQHVILAAGADNLDEDDVRRRTGFVATWQQYSGPVMAKGLEDTTLYRDPTLLSANSVGGEREVIETTVDDFHAWAARRARDWPLAMNATSTHDSKRSEDVRTRIAVLSEIPDEWESQFMVWQSLAATLKADLDGELVPDGRASLMLYQTLLGAWPLDAAELPEFSERVKAYMVKAEREAKLFTSWIDQSESYETALTRFVDDLLNDERFLDAFLPFQRRIAFHGMLSSLALTLLKITAPGVPDFYEGAELWDFSLVDPDNRRPVDYDLRSTRLREIQSGATPAELLARWESGAVKLALIHRALQVRSDRRETFERGAYIPLVVDGPRSRHILAFARRHEEDWSITLVPRLTAILANETGLRPDQPPLGADAWDDTALNMPPEAPNHWTNEMTGEALAVDANQLPVAKVLSRFPVALLTSHAH